MGQGEPINAVISGHSDQRVLVDRETDGGLRNYFLYVLLGLSGLIDSIGSPCGLRQVFRILWQLPRPKTRGSAGSELGGWKWEQYVLLLYLRVRSQ